MTYLLALDQGTSSSRSIVFDIEGHVVAQSQLELTQIYPQPGWVEHDPLEIWRTQLSTARTVLAKAGIEAHDVRAIGITNQRETTLVWNRKTGLPVHHAIVWQDRRAEPTCVALRERGLADTIKAKTGLLVDAYFSGTKLKWILDNVASARQQAANGELAFGTVDTWLIWQLTHGAVHATDVSNASRTMLFNVHTNQWDAELLQALDIPACLMPHWRRRRRPAKRLVWPSLLQSRHGQKHLWHWLLHADAHGQYVSDLAPWAHHHQCSANQHTNPVRHGRQCVCGRCRGAVVARRLASHS